MSFMLLLSLKEKPCFSSVFSVGYVTYQLSKVHNPNSMSRLKTPFISSVGFGRSEYKKSPHFKLLY